MQWILIFLNQVKTVLPMVARNLTRVSLYDQLKAGTVPVNKAEINWSYVSVNITSLFPCFLYLQPLQPPLLQPSSLLQPSPLQSLLQPLQVNFFSNKIITVTIPYIHALWSCVGVKIDSSDNKPTKIGFDTMHYKCNAMKTACISSTKNIKTWNIYSLPFFSQTASTTARNLSYFHGR